MGPIRKVVDWLRGRGLAEKFNPNHGPDGKFSSGDGGSGGGKKSTAELEAARHSVSAVGALHALTRNQNRDKARELDEKARRAKTSGERQLYQRESALYRQRAADAHEKFLESQKRESELAKQIASNGQKRN